MTLSILYISISMLSIALAIYCMMKCFQIKNKLGLFMGLCSMGAAFVQFTYLCSIFAVREFWASVGSSFYFWGIDYSLAMLLIFIRLYTMNEFRWYHKITNAVIFVLFLFDTTCVMINPFKEIVVHYVKNDGEIAKFNYDPMPLFYGHLSFSYFLVALIIFHIVRKMLQVPREYRKQFWLSIISLVVVVGINAIFLFYPQAFGKENLDYSLWGYSVAAYLIYWTCFRYPVQGMYSVYRSWILESINQGILMFNYENRLIMANENVLELFDEKFFPFGITIDEFLTRYDIEIPLDRGAESYSVQYYIKKNEHQFPVRIDFKSLVGDKHRILGTLIVFTDESGDVDILTSFNSWASLKRNVDEGIGLLVGEEPVSIAVFDINDLGEMNSRYGRNTGDKAISLLANIMMGTFPDDTRFVRGREAVLIAFSPSISLDKMKEYSEMVSEKIELDSSLGVKVHIQEAVSRAEGSWDVLWSIDQATSGMRNKKLLDERSHHSELVKSLVSTLEECDNDTNAHVKRTQIMGAELGKRLGFTDKEQSDLALLCILHDIGKIGVPLEILNKPGKLTDAEWKMLKTHATKGCQIANSSKELRGIADMILHHHERWDGNGYPDGLSKESIPLLSRVIAVVDAFDAMVNTRPYRIAMSIEKAVAELKRCAGTQFDPNIVSEFIQMLQTDALIDERKEKSDASMDVTSDEIETQVIKPGQMKELNQLAQDDVSEESDADEKKVFLIGYTRYVLSKKHVVVITDDNFEEFTGYSKEDVEAGNVNQFNLVPEEDREEYMAMVAEEMGKNQMAYFEHRLRKKNGQVIYVFCIGKAFYDSANREERVEIIVTDATASHIMHLMKTEELNRSQVRLARWEDKFRCDSLTGILNKESFRSDVELKLLEENTNVMLLMMDVDRFKQYNDSYGHKAGDDFLVKVSNTLVGMLRKDDLAARMGGDEFAAALVYKNTTPDSKMVERAAQICGEINKMLLNEKGGTSLSMGVTLAKEGSTFTSLYEAADRALYKAKENGRCTMEME